MSLSISDNFKSKFNIYNSIDITDISILYYSLLILFAIDSEKRNKAVSENVSNKFMHID